MAPVDRGDVAAPLPFGNIGPAQTGTYGRLLQLGLMHSIVTERTSMADLSLRFDSEQFLRALAVFCRCCAIGVLP